MSNSNNKMKIVYSLRVHIQLQNMGFNHIYEMKNPNMPQFYCWVYESSPEFLAAFEAIIKGRGGSGND